MHLTPPVPGVPCPEASELMRSVRRAMASLYPRFASPATIARTACLVGGTAAFHAALADLRAAGVIATSEGGDWEHYRLAAPPEPSPTEGAP